MLPKCRGSLCRAKSRRRLVWSRQETSEGCLRLPWSEEPKGFVFPWVWFLIQGRKLRPGSEVGEVWLRSGLPQIIPSIKSCCCACSRREKGHEDLKLQGW